MGDIADNRDGLQRVVDAHARWVFAAARRQVGDAALAEDVTQAVFLLYWQKGVGIEPEGKLAGWLYRAVRYCSANALRLEKIRQWHEREAAMEKQQASERSAGWSEVEGELEGAVDRLSEQDRQVVVLRFYRELSLEEVSEALGIGEAAAQKRVERAVGRLREALAAKGVEAQSLSLSALILSHAAEGGPVGLVEKVMAGMGERFGSGTAGGIAKGAGKMMARVKMRAAASLIGTLLVGLAAVAAVTAAAPPGGSAAASTQSATPTHEAMGQQITADELLGKYEQALGRISRVHYLATTQVRSEGDFNFNSLPRLQVWKFDVARDGERFGASIELLGYASGDPGGPPSQRVASRLMVTDQEYWYEMYDDDQAPDALAIRPKGVDPVKRAMRATGEDAFLSGLYVDADGTVAGVMRSASSVAVHPKTEEVAGKPVYIMEATGKYGRYTLWLDKESYLPLRMTIHKDADDLFGSIRLSRKIIPEPGCTYDIPLSPEKTRDIVIDEIQIEKRGNTYVPVGAKVTSVSAYADGQRTRWQSITSRTAVDLAPDFAALRSFEVDVPEGTPVRFVDELRQRDRVRFEWRQGKAVPLVRP
jgi:RNA polymerase sigma factor (sigma-70 family)